VSILIIIIVSKTKGGVESTQTWMFQPEAGGTKVTLEVEYTVPIPVLGKLADFVVLDGNPVADTMALRQVRMVVKEGTIVYQEGI